MSKRRTINIKRAAAFVALAGLVIFSLFTLIAQPGAHRHGTGTFLASIALAAEKKTAAHGAPEVSPRTGSDESTATMTIFKPDPLTTLAESLKAKERELAEREKALKKKEDYLESLRKETATNLAKIEELYNKLEQKSAQAKMQREKDLAKWRSIYQSMQPDKAGPIIQGLDTDSAIELLAQMDAKKAAKILSAIEPKKAVELAKRLSDKKP